MTTYNRGQVVVVEVPFSSGTGKKSRPALILSDESFHGRIPDVIVCPISSQPHYYAKPGAGDCPIRQWRAINLRYESTVRVSKLIAVDKQIVKRRLGVLSAADMKNVESVLREALAH